MKRLQSADSSAFSSPYMYAGTRLSPINSGYTRLKVVKALVHVLVSIRGMV